MSVSTVKARFADMLKTITGLQAYTNAPETLGDVPAFIILTGNAAPAPNFPTAQGGVGVMMSRREYTLRLYVKPRGQGLPGEGEDACNVWLTTIPPFLLARRRMAYPSVAGLADVFEFEYLGDSGVLVAPFAGQDFYAIDYRVAVTEAVRYTPVSGN